MHKHHGHALFIISSLGLGHATRSLPIIAHAMAHGYRISLISHGNALELLRNELGDSGQVKFYNLPDYPPLERGTGIRYYLYLLSDLFRTWRIIGREHGLLKRIGHRFNFVFSDGRYGFYSKNVPCFILTHQIDFMPPGLVRRASWLIEYINLLALRRFDCIFIPDFEDAANNLSGSLSHSRHLHRFRHRYIGILSSYRHTTCSRRDIDYLFIISGYLFEHKQTFINTLLRQSEQLPGKKVFLLGQKDATCNTQAFEKREDITIYPLADGALRQQLFARARRIITRAGYTSIMDLVEHDKKALLIPTPCQTEQQYLADYLDAKAHFATARQTESLDLKRELEKLEASSLFQPPWRTRESLSRIKDSLKPFLYQRFFSIIVPAHNERKYLTATLQSLFTQDYPAQRYEVIVVENGSTDGTAAIADHLAQRETRVRTRVLHCPQGISRAKNTGLAHIEPTSNWVLFCDADTRLGPRFLRQLNISLGKAKDTISIGTCSLAPHDPDNLYARLWFAFFDRIHQLTKTSYALQFAPVSVARQVGFINELALSEDLLFIKGCRKHGDFFFFRTREASTSARRFKVKGFFRLSLRWALVALTPLRIRRRLKYHVIR